MAHSEKQEILRDVHNKLSKGDIEIFDARNFLDKEIIRKVMINKENNMI